MRRLIFAASAAAALACASISPPPGGPVRKEPPAIVSISPDSGAVNVKDRSVVIEFDAVVRDQARGGPLSRAIILTPNTEDVSIRWQRERVEVRPKHPFLPNTAYSLTILPGISDLNNNITRTGQIVTFSTGAGIPPWAIHGRVFDWVAERVVPEAVVEAIRQTDSLPYIGLADSSGQFVLGPLDEGAYSVRTYIDANRNRIRDPNEIWDSTVTSVSAVSPFVELRAIQRDTVGPRILTATWLDSISLNVSFDRFLDPAYPLASAGFRVVAADSTRLNVARVLTAPQFQAMRLAADSAKRDTLPRDTSRAPAFGPAARPAQAAPKPTIPAPIKDVVVRLDTSNKFVPGGVYRLTTVSIRSLMGVLRTSDRVFTVPKPDTAKTPGRRP